ncbi:hypothetical protein [Paenibacillus sp. LPE1-1-1.1]|uniref:hypothetical protein n=1 Tax=Paenibacillus sp. LPE1-1-1.1 TaxID=3135230 RepID=UPI003431B920
MKIKILSILMLVFIWVPASVAFADEISGPQENGITAKEIQQIIEQKLKGVIQQDDLEKILVEQNILTEKELKDEIINMQKEKIGLLQGNISYLIGLVGAIIALLAFAGWLYSGALKRDFANKIEKMENLHEQIKTDKADIKRIVTDTTHISTVLINDRDSLKEMENKMSKSKDSYNESLEKIRFLNKKIIIQDYRFERLVKFNDFLISREKVNSAINDLYSSENDAWLEEEGLLLKVNKIADSVVKMKDETIKDKLGYYISNLHEEEQNVLKSQHNELTIEDLDSDYDLSDDAVSALTDWQGNYDIIIDIWETFKAYKSMNDKSK